MRVGIIYPSGNVERENLSFEQCQDRLGGFIQLVGLGDGISIYVNEDGKATGMEDNMPATYFCHMVGPNIGVWDHIVGPAVVVGSPGDRDMPAKAEKLLDVLEVRILASPRPA